MKTIATKLFTLTSLLSTVAIGCAVDSDDLVTEDPVADFHALTEGDSDSAGKDDSNITPKWADRGDVCHGRARKHPGQTAAC